MGCNHDNIRELLLKFWDGKTSLEEEKNIKAFFQYNEVGEDLQEDKVYFELVRQNENIVLDEDFDRIIMDKIDKKSGGVVRTMNYRSVYRIAATILIIIGIAALSWFMNNEDDKQIAETVDQEEVQKAFDETKEALLLMSSKLNKGGNHTMLLGKFNEAENVIKKEK